MRLYVIGDVHGHLDALRAAHDRVWSDGGRDAVIAHVGDLVDRGPDSRGVVDYLMRGQRDGRPWVVLRGNHDRFLPRFLDDRDWIDPGLSSGAHWVDHPALGAAATLASWGIDPDQPRDALHRAVRDQVPRDHMDFLRGLPLWYLHPRALVVHAGLRPGVALHAQAEQDLVWIRKPFLDHPGSFGPLVVHGHSAIDTATHYGNRLNVDGGAGHGRALCAVVIEPGGAALLTDGGRVPLTVDSAGQAG
ncbi:metallophosphoesterase [Paracoccus sp. (in: a-proteobacteria)]|uniref:metallophosphoesterase n=1 Tax=Paracoccus sp. TaxID=267 RepID=UPI0026E0799B|nr:metallophosphoesterase [Paracoccus sp. (in: a-proteobacteria)]MDO5647458.1 metallophosphoesterase [Paracoccus sp. (in: a-proteobacteria)]